MGQLAARLHTQLIRCDFKEGAVEPLAHAGFEPEFGARPLRRTIQRLVENELSRMVLSGTVNEGDRVRVEPTDGELRFEVEYGAAEETEAREPAGATGDRGISGNRRGGAGPQRATSPPTGPTLRRRT